MSTKRVVQIFCFPGHTHWMSKMHRRVHCHCHRHCHRHCQRNLNLVQFFLYLSFSTSFSLIWCVLIMGYSWLLYRTLSPDFIFESYYITTKLMITIEYPDNQGSPIQSDLLMGFTQYCWQYRPGCLVAPASYNRESLRNIIDVIVNRITSLYLENCRNCIFKKKISNVCIIVSCNPRHVKFEINFIIWYFHIWHLSFSLWISIHGTRIPYCSGCQGDQRRYRTHKTFDT